jgi:tripartite ATP-independent transporter DctM subunit
MSTDAVAIIGFVSLFVLMLLRVPVGMAMGLVGVTGFGYLTSGLPALKIVGHTDDAHGDRFQLRRGAAVPADGRVRHHVGHEPRAVPRRQCVLGHLRGGLGIATIAACGGFAAICGSSVATAATFSKVAYPEMRRFGYPQSFATGVIAAGGTLGIMIPPSTVFAIYGLITQQDVGKLFIAGILPGILAVAMYMITITIIGYAKPGFLPAGQKTPWSEKFAALKDIWATLLLFAFVIGGLYGGLFTATEAAGAGAGGAFLIGLVRGKLSGRDILNSLLETTRTTAAVFTILIGALLFGYFLTITQTPQKVTEFLTGLGIGPYGVLTLIMLMYLVLGCLMDALAMIILTVPIIFPVITQLGFDPIWFGVIIVMTVELGLIHPPVGMNIFVIKSVIEDVRISTIFYGVMPFILTDILRPGHPHCVPDHRAVAALANVKTQSPWVRASLRAWNKGRPPMRVAFALATTLLLAETPARSNSLRPRRRRWSTGTRCRSRPPISATTPGCSRARAGTSPSRSAPTASSWSTGSSRRSPTRSRRRSRRSRRCRSST